MVKKRKLIKLSFKKIKIDYFNIFGTKQTYFSILLMFLLIFIVFMKR